MVLMGVVGAVKCVLEDFWQGLRQRRRRYATPCLSSLVDIIEVEVSYIYEYDNYLDYYPRL